MEYEKQVYEKQVKALRICSSEINCGECPFSNNYSCSSDDMLQDAANSIEELLAQVRDKDYLIQQQADEIKRLQRDVKKQQEKMIELAKRLPHWVSVEERLPNVDEKVLVFAIGKLDGFIGDTVIALTSMSDTNWLNHHEKVDKPYWLDPWQYFLTDYRITHWMPLPEPPQEVQDETEIQG